MAYDPKTAGFNPEQQYFDPWAFDFSLPEEPAPLPAVPAPTDANARRLLVPDGGDPGMPDDGTPTDRGTPGLDPSLGGPKDQWQGPGTGLGGQVPEDWWSDQFSNSWGQTAFEKAGMIAGPIGSVITGGINAKINIDKYNEVAEKMGLEKMGVGTGIAQTLAPFDVVGRMAQRNFRDAMNTGMEIYGPGIEAAPPTAVRGYPTTMEEAWAKQAGFNQDYSILGPEVELSPGSQMNYAGRAPEAVSAPTPPSGYGGIGEGMVNTSLGSMSALGGPGDPAIQAFNSMMDAVGQMQRNQSTAPVSYNAPANLATGVMANMAALDDSQGGWTPAPADYNEGYEGGPDNTGFKDFSDWIDAVSGNSNVSDYPV